MKQKEKGFTLIELLAIIVILGIIAVIAVPTVKKLTDEAKLKAFENTARGIIKAGNLYYSRKDMMDELNGDMTFSFPDNAEELELQGKLPENGSMIINEDGDVALAISNKKYCITKRFDTNDIEIKEDYEKCKNPGIPVMVSENNCIKTGMCSDNDILAGIKVTVNVNDNENYDFYVIKDTGTELTLIMDRNIGEQIAWVSALDYKDNDNYGTYGNNNKGPITVLNYLNNEISDWDNIPAITSYTYGNNLNGTTYSTGYQKLEITNGTGILTSQDGSTTTTVDGIMRARLLTSEEANFLKSMNSNTMPTWLYTNLSVENTIESPWGYWYLTAFTYISSLAYNTRYDGLIYDTHVRENCGVRPVIILPK